ncbi:CLUMA_CG019757, isoform A [Clunio marinus]|uniref:CLUMA_CG019757, isoform A n=1 Tax=Clunio marinus TaxID=568069 RepID=A0A1J1J5N0_9DIPT|nr:CLUMA_CG019757, isoform A [Clunio marinus]
MQCQIVFQTWKENDESCAMNENRSGLNIQHVLLLLHLTVAIQDKSFFFRHIRSNDKQQAGALKG